MLEEFLNGFAIFSKISPVVPVAAANGLILAFFALFLFLKTNGRIFISAGRSCRCNVRFSTRRNFPTRP